MLYRIAHSLPTFMSSPKYCAGLDSVTSVPRRPKRLRAYNFGMTSGIPPPRFNLRDSPVQGLQMDWPSSPHDSRVEVENSPVTVALKLRAERLERGRTSSSNKENVESGKRLACVLSSQAGRSSRYPAGNPGAKTVASGNGHALQRTVARQIGSSALQCESTFSTFCQEIRNSRFRYAGSSQDRKS